MNPIPPRDDVSEEITDRVNSLDPEASMQMIAIHAAMALYDALSAEPAPVEIGLTCDRCSVQWAGESVLDAIRLGWWTPSGPTTRWLCPDCAPTAPICGARFQSKHGATAICRKIDGHSGGHIGDAENEPAPPPPVAAPESEDQPMSSRQKAEKAIEDSRAGKPWIEPPPRARKCGGYPPGLAPSIMIPVSPHGDIPSPPQKPAPPLDEEALRDRIAELVRIATCSVTLTYLPFNEATEAERASARAIADRILAAMREAGWGPDDSLPGKGGWRTWRMKFIEAEKRAEKAEEDRDEWEVACHLNEKNLVAAESRLRIALKLFDRLAAAGVTDLYDKVTTSGGGPEPLWKVCADVKEWRRQIEEKAAGVGTDSVPVRDCTADSKPASALPSALVEAIKATDDAKDPYVKEAAMAERDEWRKALAEKDKECAMLKEQWTLADAEARRWADEVSARHSVACKQCGCAAWADERDGCKPSDPPRCLMCEAKADIEVLTLALANENRRANLLADDVRVKAGLIEVMARNKQDACEYCGRTDLGCQPGTCEAPIHKPDGPSRIAKTVRAKPKRGEEGGP